MTTPVSQHDGGDQHRGRARERQVERIGGAHAHGAHQIEHAATVTYTKNGRTLAVATVFRDTASLEAEATMEALSLGPIAPEKR